MTAQDMKQLKISVAGVRGIVGRGLDAETAVSFAQAFATYLEGGTIAICHDTRPSANMLRASVLAGLLSSGTRVVDLGIVPSPTLRLALPNLHANGGIIIAAGHNPTDWNALKFLRGDGMYLSARQGQELLEIFSHGEFRKAQWDEIHPLEYSDRAIEEHLNRILQLFPAEPIRKRRFKVAVDCCNGPCSLLTPRLLEALDCEVVALNNNPARPFPRLPNPTPDNMSQLEALVRASGADVGFAHDAEGERLGIVTNEGIALHQEMTLAIAVYIALETGWCTQPIVINISTSRMIESLAAKHGVRVIRTPTGQAHVSEQALLRKADIAGEGSGQVILPRLHPGPDGIAAIAFFLHYLAGSQETISNIVEQIPVFYMRKENIPLASNRAYRTLQRLRELAQMQKGDFAVDLTDGVKLESPDGWVHVRASMTESMLRIIVESPDPGRAKELQRWIRDQVLE